MSISHLSQMMTCRRLAGIKTAGSLEKWLTESWEKIGSLKQAATKSAERALFGRITLYIWNLLREVSKTYDNSNGYYLFAKGLKAQDEAFGLISFNYDTLLDRSQFHAPGFIFQSRFNGTFRDAQASGNVSLGGVNLATQPSLFAQIVSVREGSVTID